MQNVTDQHLPVVQVMITVPTAGRAEAFVDAADIAGIIAGAVGRSIIRNDIGRSAWIDGPIADGAMPPGYRVMLNWLTATIASGHRSRPNDDVRRVTGSPPASFTDYARRNAHVWALPAALS